MSDDSATRGFELAHGGRKRKKENRQRADSRRGTADADSDEKLDGDDSPRGPQKRKPGSRELPVPARTVALAAESPLLAAAVLPPPATSARPVDSSTGGTAPPLTGDQAPLATSAIHAASSTVPANTQQQLGPAAQAASSSASAPTPTPSSAPTQSQRRPAPAQRQEQQLQQPQQRGGAGKPRRQRGRAVPASQRLVERCGAQPFSETSLVLTLTAAAASAGKFNRLPHASANDSRSVAAVAGLLDRLHIAPPRMPQAYNQCSTLRDLIGKLPLDIGAGTGVGIDSGWPGRLQGATETELGRLLLQLAGVLLEVTNDNTVAVAHTWLQMLTPYTSCMGRPGQGQQRTGAAGTAARNTDAEPRDSRCVLRLDFASPIARLCIQTHLDSLATTAAAAAASLSAQRPAATFSVSRYRHRLTAVRVSGFAVGPTAYDPTGRFTSPAELHGNWHLLRQWLQTVAPHCKPDPTPLTTNRGVGAVDFVLEETHRHELQALHQAVAPEAGVYRPLQLTISVRRQSPDVACSTCGQAGHRARDCLSRPTDGTRTCKACFATGHTAERCPAPAAERKCGMCGGGGHATLQCHRYRPRWVDLVQPAGGARAPPQQRSTFAADRVALLRGTEPARPQPPAQQHEQLCQPPPRTGQAFPPLPSGPTSASSSGPTSCQTNTPLPASAQWAGSRQRVASDKQAGRQLRLAGDDDTQTTTAQRVDALEAVLTRMAEQMMESQRRMEEAQRVSAKQMEMMQAMMMHYMQGVPAFGIPHQPLYQPTPGGGCGGPGAMSPFGQHTAIVAAPASTAQQMHQHQAQQHQQQQQQSQQHTTPESRRGHHMCRCGGITYNGPVGSVVESDVSGTLSGSGSTVAGGTSAPTNNTTPAAIAAQHQTTERPTQPPAYGSYPAPPNVSSNVY